MTVSGTAHARRGGGPVDDQQADAISVTQVGGYPAVADIDVANKLRACHC